METLPPPSRRVKILIPRAAVFEKFVPPSTKKGTEFMQNVLGKRSVKSMVFECMLKIF